MMSFVLRCAMCTNEYCVSLWCVDAHGQFICKISIHIYSADGQPARSKPSDIFWVCLHFRISES